MSAHLASHRSRGMFQGAIMQSGAPAAWTAQPYGIGSTRFNQLASATGCGPDGRATRHIGTMETWTKGKLATERTPAVNTGAVAADGNARAVNNFGGDPRDALACMRGLDPNVILEADTGAITQVG